GLAGALALSVLGPRTEPLALAGVAAALLLVGLYGRSRFWLRVGALALALTALWGAWMTVGFGAVPLLASPDDLRTALLGAAPAALGLLAAWRVGRDSWAMTLPRQVRKTSAQSVENAPRTELSRIPTLLAGLCSAVLALALLAAGSAALAGGVLIAAAALWTRSQERSENTVPFWVAAPLLTLGSLLLTQATVPTPPLLLGVAVALLAGAALLRAAGRSFADAAPRGLAEGTALTVLALALTRAAQEWWPALGLPGALALLAVLTAPLRLALGWSRMDALLGLGGLVLLSLIMAGWPVDVPDSYGGANDRIQVAALGGPLLAAAWWLTRTAGGLLRWLAPLTRPFGGLPPDAGAQPPVAQALWLGAWALLVPLALGVRFSVLKADLKPWLVASSLALLLVGLVAAVRAHRAGNTGGAGGTGAPWARALWTAGLALIAGAGVKGALLDAAYFPNSAAGLGIAVLVTGLSLLAVAILAPRPAAPAPASEKLSGGPPG
ncbi:hypothetical protein, partial [Deinococcus frigens]|uniref:hypothetical protein n=1 Tax=Deinococcus frigens TaxID=249403 RepID=UPI0039EEC1F5